MAVHPISYVKTHPWGTVATFAAGMIFGPWLVSSVGSMTGVNLSLPSYGSGGS